MDADGTVRSGQDTKDLIVHVRFNEPGVQMISVYDSFITPFKFALTDYRQNGSSDILQAAGGGYQACNNGKIIQPGDIVDGDFLYTIYIYVKEK